MKANWSLSGIILLVIFLLTGCGVSAALTVLQVAETARFGMNMAVGVSKIHKEISRADVKMAVGANPEEVIAASLAAFKKLGIEVKEKNLSETKDAAIITGTAGKDGNFKIAVAQVSSNSSEIGIWAKRGFARTPEYAQLISSTISESFDEDVAVKQIEKKKKGRFKRNASIR